MSEPPSVNNLFILVDGQNFISQIRKLFREEFDEEDYLPRNANWARFFYSIAKTLGAKTLNIGWFTIKELDFSPNIDWEQEDLNQFSDEEYLVWRKLLIRRHVLRADKKDLHKMKTTFVEKEYFDSYGKKEKKKTINRWRKICRNNEEKMKLRLAEWHQLQDEIVAQCPNVEMRRTGWQLCQLKNMKLETEKGVDTGLVTDLIYRGQNYDTILVFSSDGDFVPAIYQMQRLGKKVGHAEFEFRTGVPVPGTSRRLSDLTDFALGLPYDDIKEFLGIPDQPVQKKKELRRAEEQRQRLEETEKRHARQEKAREKFNAHKKREQE